MLPDSSVHSKAEDLLYFTVQHALTERYIHISIISDTIVLVLIVYCLKRSHDYVGGGEPDEAVEIIRIRFEKHCSSNAF